MVSINPEMIKGIASKAGEVFNRVMSSGNIPEGSIFDAASKLGINNTDDLKGAFEKVKANPKETITNALNKLHDQGFIIGQPNKKTDAAKGTEAAAKTETVEETDAVAKEETPQIEDKNAGMMEKVTKTLKSAGLDLQDADVQKNIADFAANPDKLKEFIAKKIGLGGAAGGKLNVDS
ncbi:MAG: hypothetical protein K6C94_00590 [Candidatus Gastranaerophilales bacterium]|nr:hypothetical protein [Candidatus Gastranaerophilales bacterium]